MTKYYIIVGDTYHRLISDTIEIPSVFIILWVPITTADIHHRYLSGYISRPGHSGDILSDKFSYDYFLLCQSAFFYNRPIETPDVAFDNNDQSNPA